jgi:aspartate 1-decarboxylase
MDEAEARSFVPRVVFVDQGNRIVEIGGDPALVPDGFGLAASGTPRGQL